MQLPRYVAIFSYLAQLVHDLSSSAALGYVNCICVTSSTRSAVTALASHVVKQYISLLELGSGVLQFECLSVWVCRKPRASPRLG